MCDLSSRATPDRTGDVGIPGPTAAEVDAAMARLWPDGAWERMLASVRGFLADGRARGYRAATVAAMLRDAMPHSLAELGADDRDAEVILSTFHRAIDRILEEP